MVRRISSFLAALGVLIAMISPAVADPVTLTLGAAISSLLTAGGSASIAATLGLSATSLITLTAASNFIAAALLTGAAYLFASTGGGKIDPGKAKETLTATEGSEIRALGRVRLGGLVAFGSTNQTRRFRLILHARLVDGFEDFFLGGFEVIRNDAGDVLSKPYRIAGTNYINIKTDPGDEAKTAWADLITYFPALWTSNHRARGIAQSLVLYISPGLTSTRFLRLYQGGIPNLETVARGERLFDPRLYLASPATHNPDDPATWSWSDNGVLAVLHVAAQYQEFGYAAFDLAQIADAADDADVSVDTLTGSEPRSRCWGVWPSEGPRGDTLAQLLASTGCEMFTTDSGLIGIRLIDDDRDAEVEFAAERHVVSVQWRSGPESVERPNRCRVKYYAPERRYEMAEIDTSALDWANYLDEIDVVGEQILDIDLPFCPSASQAQRIARRLFAVARADRGVAVLNMSGMAAWGCKVVDLEHPDLLVTFRSIISPARCRDGDGTVELPFVVQPDLAPWDETTMEAAAPAEVPEIVYAGASDAPAAPTAVVVITYPDASTETRIALVLPTGGSFQVDAAAFEVAYRTHDALPSEWRQMSSVGNAVAFTGYLAGAALLGVPCEFRLRGSNTDDENTAWSPSYLATPGTNNAAPSAPGGSYDSGTTVLTVIAPASLQVASLRVTSPSAAVTDYPVRPGQAVQISGPELGTWSAVARSSDGTASASTNYLVSV